MSRGFLAAVIGVAGVTTIASCAGRRAAVIGPDEQAEPHEAVLANASSITQEAVSDPVATLLATTTTAEVEQAAGPEEEEQARPEVPVPLEAPKPAETAEPGSKAKVPPPQTPSPLP